MGVDRRGSIMGDRARCRDIGNSTREDRVRGRDRDMVDRGGE